MRIPRLLFVCVLLAIGSASGFSQEPTIQVTLLGTGKPEPEIERFGPSTLVTVGGQRLVFDVGRGAAQRLSQIKVRLGSIDAVFLTHLHSDHVVGLPDLWLTSWLPTPFGRRQAPLAVFGPPGTRAMAEHLQQAYAWDIRARNAHQKLSLEAIKLDARDVRPGLVYDRNGIKVTAFDVIHGEELKPSYGYRVDYAGRSVVISGDTNYSESLIKAAKGCDVLIHEVATSPKNATDPVVRSIMRVHTSPEDAARVFRAVQPKLAVFTHVALLSFDPTVPRPTVAELVDRTHAGYTGRVEVGEDLMTIQIGENVKVSRFVHGEPKHLEGNSSIAGEESGAKEAVTSFFAAFNSHDWNSIEQFASDDWNHINPLGGWTRSPEAVAQELKEVHSTFLKGVADKPEQMTVRLVTPQVAIVVVPSSMSTYITPDGVKHESERHIRTFVVVKRNGRWLIEHDQNTTVLHQGQASLR